MEAYNKSISGVFSSGGAIHYILPYFQREYIWDEQQWETLINDLIAIYNDSQDEKELEHFLGSVVVVDDGIKNGTIPALKLVDGQQRLITISLLLCVLRELTKSSNPTLALKIDTMLVNMYETGDIHLKVLPNTKCGDRDAYVAIINGSFPSIENSRIFSAYKYLYKTLDYKIHHDENKIDIEKLYKVLVNCFQVVFISLNGQTESPYKIFESLNAKAKPLTRGDLVRNYIAMTLPGNLQEVVFKEYWAKIEELLQEQNNVGQVGELTAFIRHYLATKSGVLYAEEHIYQRFRNYMQRHHSDMQAFIDEISVLSRFAGYYDKLLRPEHESHPTIRKMLTHLNTLEISTAYPLLLTAYEALHTGRLIMEDFINLLKMLENTLVRRYICAERTNQTNKWFPTLWRDIEQKETELGLGFTDACRQALSSKYYPSDRQIRQAVLEVKIYGRTAQQRAKIGLVLETIEHHLWADSDVTVQLNGNSTIEHIMPQSLTPVWKTELGNTWQQTHEDYLHTLGNLTLVTQGKNAQLSNTSFTTKRKIFMTHGLRLNSYFSNTFNRWDADAIRARAHWLGEKILEIWPSLTDTPRL